MARYLAWLHAHTSGEPTPAYREDAPGRSQAPKDRKHVWGSARGRQESSDGLAQGTMLYASELTWSGGVWVEGEYQRAINRMGGATLGVFRSTPLGIIAAEGGHMSARALLNHR